MLGAHTGLLWPSIYNRRGGGGPPPSYVGPLDIVANATLAFGNRAMSSAKRGTALYTIRRSSDDAAQSFNSDVTTGLPPSSDISTFLGSSPFTLVSVGLVDGGTGYGDFNTFDVILVGGVFTTAAVVNVTTTAGGAVSKINSITTKGSYSALPANPVATTGGDGTGLTVTCTFSNGFVSTYNDQSALSNNAVQATAARQPGFNLNISNSLPALNLGKLSQSRLITENNVTLPNGEYTVFVAGSLFTPNTSGHIQNSLLGINYDQFAGSGADLVVAINSEVGGVKFWDDASSDGDNTNEAGGRSDTIAGFVDGIHIVDVAWKFESNSCVVNNVDIPIDSSFDVGPVGSVDGFPVVIGAGDSIPTTGQHYNGYCLELIAYPSILSDANRLLIRQNMAVAYGVTLL